MLSTGISEHLDYDTLYQLSSLYSLQEIYKSLGYQILETILSSKILIYAMNPGIGEEDLDDQIYRDQIALFVEAEAQLLKVMQDTRRLLETVNGE